MPVKVVKRGLKGEFDSSDILIPVTILADRSLSILEVIAEYLREEIGLNYHQIAVLTNRNDRTIWTVYNRAKKKRATVEKPKFKPSNIEIPLKALLDRTVSSLEALVEYMKDEMQFTFHQIAMLTNRNDRTIWTVYDRARKKRKHGKKA